MLRQGHTAEGRANGTFNRKMVSLARESRGLTQSELAGALKVEQGTISKIESGVHEPSDELIEGLVKALRYPVEFFHRTDEVYPFGAASFYHRKRSKLSSRTLRQIQAKVNITRMHVCQLAAATDLDSRCVFRALDPDECGGPEEVARLVRAAWRLGPGPIDNLVEVVERAGGIVVHFDFGTRLLDGISEWLPPAPPLFCLNAHPDIPGDRQRLTLAHEVGHVFMHSLPHPDIESEANRFAAELLVPGEEVAASLRPPLRLRTLGQLKPYWKISMGALIEKAHSDGHISDKQRTSLWVQMTKYGFRKREPQNLDIPREKPSLLREIIEAHLGELGYQPHSLARLIDLQPWELQERYKVEPESRLVIVR